MSAMISPHMLMDMRTTTEMEFKEETNNRLQTLSDLKARSTQSIFFPKQTCLMWTMKALQRHKKVRNLKFFL